jgi:hypothetical protein
MFDQAHTGTDQPVRGAGGNDMTAAITPPGVTRS